MLSRPTYMPEMTPIMPTMKRMITRYLCQSEASSFGIRFINGFLIRPSSLPLELGSRNLVAVYVVMTDDTVS